MSGNDKPLVWLRTVLRTPPVGVAARREAGLLLRKVQRGDALNMPRSRPMPVIGERCHELRVRDRDADWRMIYRIDVQVILVVHLFRKTTRTTPQSEIELAQARLKEHDRMVREHGDQ